MLSTAVAALLALAGSEILLLARAQSWFAAALAPGSATYPLLLLVLAILNILASWYLARWISLRLWPELAEGQPARRRFRRQQEF